MHLVQLLLPIHDNAGSPFPDTTWDETHYELSTRFGGITAYNRAPAEGVWRPSPGRWQQESVVVVEVMAEEFDPAWWKAYRAKLEARFRQQSLVVRAWRFESL